MTLCGPRNAQLTEQYAKQLLKVETRDFGLVPWMNLLPGRLRHPFLPVNSYDPVWAAQRPADGAVREAVIGGGDQ